MSILAFFSVSIFLLKKPFIERVRRFKGLTVKGYGITGEGFKGEGYKGLIFE